MKNVVVVGSGIAGQIAALVLSRRFEVTLVTKARTESRGAHFRTDYPETSAAFAYPLFQTSDASTMAPTC